MGARGAPETGSPPSLKGPGHVEAEPLVRGHTVRSPGPVPETCGGRQHTSVAPGPVFAQNSRETRKKLASRPPYAEPQLGPILLPPAPGKPARGGRGEQRPRAGLTRVLTVEVEEPQRLGRRSPGPDRRGAEAKLRPIRTSSASLPAPWLSPPCVPVPSALSPNKHLLRSYCLNFIYFQRERQGEEKGGTGTSM